MITHHLDWFKIEFKKQIISQKDPRWFYLIYARNLAVYPSLAIRTSESTSGSTTDLSFSWVLQYMPPLKANWATYPENFPTQILRARCPEPTNIWVPFLPSAPMEFEFLILGAIPSLHC